MKISEEFRGVAEAPFPGRFYYVLTPAAEGFARIQFGPECHPSISLSDEEKTLAYLFLAAIAESEGL